MKHYAGILSLIGSKSAITDEIGTSPTRLFPNVIPQGYGTFPAGTYRTVDVGSTPTFDGGGQMNYANIDFHIYAQTMTKAEEIVDLFRGELEDEEGTFSGVQIKTVRYMGSGQDSWEDNIEKYTKNIELQFIIRR